MKLWKARIYVSLVSVSIVAVLLGLSIYGSSFVSNLLAEGAGIFISITIGFALVDRLIESEARRKWARVSAYTARTISFHLGEIHFAVQTSHVVPERKFVPGMTTAEHFRAMADHIAERAEELATQHDNDEIVLSESGDNSKIFALGEATIDVRLQRDGTTKYIVAGDQGAAVVRRLWGRDESSGRLYEEFESHLQQFRDVLTPRIIEFGYNYELVEALVRVEEAEKNWKSTLGTIEGWGMPEQYGWDSCAQLLDACAMLAERVAPLIKEESNDEQHALVQAQQPFGSSRQPSSHPLGRGGTSGGDGGALHD